MTSAQTKHIPGRRAVALAAAFLVAISSGFAAGTDGTGGSKAQPKAGSSNQTPQKQWPQKTGAQKEEKSPAENYTVEQAVSDRAQLHTIAFNGLAFLTGTFGADTFLPPGKVADYFGFQYMRDIDEAKAGHNTNFLTRIANETWKVLGADQRAALVKLASAQAPRYRELAEMRLPLIAAFRAKMEGTLPGTLTEEAAARWVSEIFSLDGRLALERAAVYGAVAEGLTAEQQRALSALDFGNSATWDKGAPEIDKKGMSHEENVAVMTYASEFFSWYAGSPAADVYFCPERHGTYFGGFYMKDYPAMGNPDYYIPTALTGDSGAEFLDILTPDQRELITGIVEEQRADIARIVEIRTAVSEELRKYLAGTQADEAAVDRLSAEYGEIDGRLSWLYDDRFSAVAATLTAEQREKLIALRNQNVFPKGAYLYSNPIDAREAAIPAELGGLAQ